MTKLLEDTKATTEATQVNSFTLKIEVQETCEAESQVFNKEIEHGITYKDIHFVNHRLPSLCFQRPTSNSLKVASQEEILILFFFHVTSSYILMLVSCFNLILPHIKLKDEFFQPGGE